MLATRSLQGCARLWKLPKVSIAKQSVYQNNRQNRYFPIVRSFSTQDRKEAPENVPEKKLTYREMAEKYGPVFIGYW